MESEMKQCNFEGVGNIHLYSVEDITDLKNEFDQLCKHSLELRDKHDIAHCTECNDPISKESLGVEGITPWKSLFGVKRCLKCHYWAASKIRATHEGHCNQCGKVTPHNELWNGTLVCYYHSNDPKIKNTEK